MAGLTKIKSGGFADGCALPSDATATTQSSGDNSTKIATTAYADAAGGASDKIEEGNTNVECVDSGSDGHILFDTEGSERMRIDSSGKVGIGTNSPNQELHVNGDIQAGGDGNNGTAAGIVLNSNGVMHLTHATSGSAVMHVFTGGSTTSQTSLYANGSAIFNDGGNGVDFRVESDTNQNMLFVDGSANAVGIGTSTPGNTGGETLEVNGNVRIGNIHAGYGENAASHNTNVVFGSYSGQSFTAAGRRNVAIGHEAGRYITDGDENVCIGYRIAMDSNGVTGSKNVGIGDEAMQDITSGESNTFVGRRAGHALTTGDFNVGIGAYAMYAGVMTGDYNVAMGSSSGASLTSGSYNTTYGTNTGGNLTEGDYNTMVGYQAGLGTATGDNNLLIGYRAGYNGSPSGNIGNSSNILCLGDGSITDFYCQDTSISSSDQRDKADITDFTHGLDWVTQMRPVTYRWDKREWYVDWEANPDTDLLTVTTDGTHKKDRLNIGLLSQEVQVIEKADGFSTNNDNELICKTNADGTAIGLKYERIVPVLINAIKELKTANDALTARVAALEAG